MGLTNAGRNLLASLLAASLAGTSTAWLGIGDSSTAYAAGQTDLQAATNKYREDVDGAPGVSVNIVTYIATVASGNANFAWNEFGLFNASVGGTMFNRLVSAQGTKASGQVWQLTMQLTFAVG